MAPNLVLLLALGGARVPPAAPMTLVGTPAPAGVIVVVGAPGSPEYGELFGAWAERWERAAARAALASERVGPGAADGPENDRERLAALVSSAASGADALWIVFLGHGTFDGESAKLNLRGPDVSARELAVWLEPVERPTAVVVCAAASGPFVSELSRAGRIVVTATKSGHEYSYARFGEHLSTALTDPAADLDKDDQVSLLEAFLFASAGVEEFYAGAARLATEHALLDDNGDGLGTPASWFRGVRATRTPEAGRLADGVRAQRLCLVPSARERALPEALRRERDALELAVEELRARKGELEERAYYELLEPLMVELARLWARAEEPAEEGR